MSLVSKLTYSYDNAGQLLSEVQNLFTIAAKTNRYTYDSDGLRLTHTYPAGNVITNTYTARNQIASIIADGPPPLATFAYDANGNRTAKTLENNTSIAYAYDNASRMLTVDHKLSSVSFASFAYGYNAVGNRTSRVESGTGLQPVTDTYTYDATDQVATVNYNASQRVVSYQWDAVGNRTTVTDNGTGTNYTANSLNQYTAIGGGAPTYDTKGNLITQNGWTYTFDAQNRLLTANNSSTTASFNYDARNRCVSRTINGVTSLLIYDSWNLIEEWTTGGAQIAHYVHGPRMDELLVKVSTTNAVYYHHDALGNVTHLTGTNGAVVEKYTYDIFGKPTILDANSQLLSATAFGNRMLFTGREWLAEISLYDYRNRIYSQDLGRFLQTDPIRFAAGDVDLYGYALNNPFNSTDPFGLSVVANPNWPPIQIPPGGPSNPPTGGGKGNMAAAILFGLVQAGVQAHFNGCQKKCSQSDCESCCNKTTYAGIAADAAAGVSAAISCSAWVVPWKVAACLLSTAAIQASADQQILDSQKTCLAACKTKSNK